MNFLPKILPRPSKSQDDFERELLRFEAETGKQLFGPVPKGHRREFFCLDYNTWIWHEEWMERGKRRLVTTRYELHPSGVLKIQDGHAYQHLSEPEARNLYWAIELYRQRVGSAYDQVLQPA